MIEVKTNVNQLKESTKALSQLWINFQTKLQHVLKVYRTSFCLKQSDKLQNKVSETLESLTSASDNMKTDFDQETCQLLSNTTTIVDNLKRHSESQNQSPT